MRATTGRPIKTDSLNNDQNKLTKKSPTTTTLPVPGLVELQRLLGEHLSTKVSIVATAGRGRMTVEFADLNDLERIYRAMTDGVPNGE